MNNASKKRQYQKPVLPCRVVNVKDADLRSCLQDAPGR